MKYAILILLVFLMSAFVEFRLNPMSWHTATRIAAVLLIGVGIFFVDKADRERNRK